MRIRWTPAAANDLELIANYLYEKTPDKAVELVRQIYRAAYRLSAFPRLGRPGKSTETREFVVPAMPYKIVYKISGDAVHILRILHGKQDWPGTHEQ